MIIIRLSLFVSLLFLYQWPIAKMRVGEISDPPWVFFLGLAVYSLFPLYILWTFLGVWAVQLYGDTLKLKHFFRSRTIFIQDIEAYATSFGKTKVKHYNGVLIKLKSGEMIEVSEYNVSNVDKLQDFLDAADIPNRGKKQSWFPLTRSI